MNWKFYFLNFAFFVLLMLRSQGAAFDLGASQLPVVLVPGFNHADLYLPITGTSGNFDFNLLQVNSDSPWVTPQVDVANGRVILRFSTSALTNSSYTSTISASHGANSDTVFVNASLSARNIFKLMADPMRSRMYGIQLNGVNRGAIVVIDPLTGSAISSVTVGNKPTGMAVSNDGSELFIINVVDKTITVVNLSTLQVTQTLLLPTFGNWDVGYTTANIGVGPGNILYYTDGAWSPLLRVYNRSTGLVVQTVSIDGPSTGYGFGDFALNSSKTQLYGWAQYGWSAGWGGSYIGKFNVATNGTLTFVEKTNSNSPTNLNRDPLETPVLISGDEGKLFIKQLMMNPATINSVERSFSGPVYSITPGGEVAVTANAIFQTSTGNKIYDLPITTSIHAITTDYSRLVYYNTATRTITSLDLIAAIGSEVMGRTLSPSDGSIVLPPEKLNWSSIPGAVNYRVYLGTSSAAVSAATTASPECLGNTTLPEFTLTETLTSSTTYYWRVDSQVGSDFTIGTIYSFSVSPISSSLTKVDAVTVQGHPDHRTSISLTSDSPGIVWTASADQNWVSFADTSGTTPSNLEIRLNATTLPVGMHEANVTLSSTNGVLFTIPVNFKVEPLALTILKSDPTSSKIYAISENTAVTEARAYLLEIDSTTETIQRVVQVGTSVTDLAIHNGDNRIYIPNWRPGSLLALNKTTLALERTYAFSPFAGIGYGANDAYRVSAGAAGRIVVEEYDQWVDLSIFNTNTGAELGTIALREGGGAFDPTGRYYFHGENNSSGAEISKLDVTGDVFTRLANIRVSSYSYYGSRVVVVSENGNGVFWNGSYFNSNLVEQWTMGAETYSSTPDARLAFGDSKIFDTVSRSQVLAMPLTTRVSTYNSTSKKLVVQNGSRLRFYTVQIPLSLPAPELSSGTITQTSIALSWTDASLETGFTLQQRPAGGTVWTNLTPAINANQTTFAVNGLSPETEYEFRIKADAPTVSSNWSPLLSVRTLAPPPPTVTLTTAITTGDSVTLGFSSTGNPTAIFIEKAITGDGPWFVLTTLSGTATSYTDSALDVGTTFHYRIKAARGAVESAYSASMSVTIPTPSATISNLINSSGNVQILISATNNPASIRIERSSSDSGPWSVLNSVSGVTTSYFDSSVVASTTYYYRLKAVLGTFESSYSAVRSITTPAPAVPTSPSGFAITSVSATQISLRWNDSASETGYQLDRRLASDINWIPLATLPANNLTYNDTQIIPGTAYIYRLSAFNVAGSSPTVQSNTVVATNLITMFEDDFEPNFDPIVWLQLSVSSSINGGQGFNGTRALWFGHSGTRSATTNPVSIVPGARVIFDFRAGNSAIDGTTYWENSELGENVLLEYSLDGAQWTTLQTISTVFPEHNNWQTITVTVPEGAISPNTLFRWRQVAHSGQNFDTWAIDNLQIQSSGQTNTIFLEQPVPELVMEGAPKTLQVRLNRGGFRFQWFKDDVLIPSANQSSYAITSSRPSHAGLYHCVATSDSMTLESDKAMVGVVQPIGYNSLLRVRQGGNIALSMRIFPSSLASQISFDWYRLIEGGLSGIGTVTGSTTATLSISNVTTEAVGSYYCFLSYQGVHTLDVGPYRVSVLSAPEITPIADETFYVGYNVAIPVLVNDFNATVSVLGLPQGLRYDPATKSIIGVPTVARTSTVTVNARNAYGNATPMSFVLVTSPFPNSLSGTYQGIIEASVDNSLPNGGHLAFQVGRTGATSLTVTLGASTHRLKSSVQVQEGGKEGLLRVSIQRRSLPTLTLEILLNNSDTQTGTMLSHDEQQISAIQTVKNTWTKVSQTSEAGVFNLSLTPEEIAAYPDYPMGHGFIRLTNAATGSVRWSGRLADGVAITSSTIMGSDGDIPVYKSIYTGEGSIGGWIRCEYGDASGSLRWFKQDHSAKIGTRIYKSGIPAHLLDINGGRYLRPANGTALLSELGNRPNNALLLLTEGTNLFDHEQPVTLTTKQTVERPPTGLANPLNVRLVINAATGMISGSFELKDANPANLSQLLTRKVLFSGCLIPGQNRGLGYFLLPELPEASAKSSSLSRTPMWSGAVELIPAN